MTRVQRLCRLEAHRQRTLEAMVDALERDPVVARYMQALSDAELRLLAQGDAGALQRFALACPHLTVR
jgi:hypothetical protein